MALIALLAVTASAASNVTLRLEAPVNAVLLCPSCNSASTSVLLDEFAILGFELSGNVTAMNATLLTLSSTNTSVLPLTGARATWHSSSNASLAAGCTGVGTTTLFVDFVLLTSPLGLDAYTARLDVTCKPAALSCAALSNCSGRGVCIASAGPTVRCQCSNPNQYFGRDCGNSAVLAGVSPAAFQLAPAPELSVCAGATLRFDVAVSARDGSPDDSLVLMDVVTSAVIDTIFMSSSRFVRPSTPIASARLNVTLAAAGRYAIIQRTPGSASEASVLASISVQSNSSCLSALGDCRAPGARPCVRGLCNATTGTCDCPPGEWYFGARCELGCARHTHQTVRFGAEVSDGSGDWMPSLPSTRCNSSVLLSQPRTASLRVSFVRFDVDPAVPLLVTNSAGAVIAALSGDALPQALVVPGTFVAFSYGAGARRAAGGFVARVTALGCKPGWYVDPLGARVGNESYAPVCLACPAGTFSSTADSLACTPCAPGSYSTAPGSLVCKLAAYGQFVSDAGAISFSACLPGTYANVQGSVACVGCAPGYVAPRPGMSACERCNSSGYSVAGESVRCRACPLNTVSAVDGAEDIVWCRCLPGYFSPNGSAGEACEPCPPGGVCAGGTDAPRPLAGYWAGSSDPNRIFKCVRASACPGGAPDACASGYVGTLCSRCPHDHQNTGLLCRRCSSRSSASLVFIVLIGIAVLAFIYQTANLNTNDNLHSTVGLGTAFGLWIQYLQIAVLFREYRVGWPKAVSQVFIVLSVVNLDISFLEPGCSFNMRYETKLYLKLATPLFVAGALALAHAIHLVHKPLVGVTGPLLQRWAPRFADVQAHAATIGAFDATPTARLRARVSLYIVLMLSQHTPMVVARSLNAFLAITEIFFVFLVVTAFEPFSCMSNYHGVSTLVAEPAIDCYSPRWRAMLPVVILAIFGLCVVLPLVYAYAVWAIQSSEQSMTTRHASAWARFSSLVFKYKNEHRWWLFAILVRKLAIVVVVTALPAQPMAQSVFSMLVLLAALLAQFTNAPFRIAMHNVIDHSLLLSNIVLLILGISFYSETMSASVRYGATVSAIGLLLLSSLVMFMVFAREFWRFVSDRPVNRESTLAELFARRHLDYHPAALRALRCMQLPSITVFRMFSIACDDQLQALVTVSSLLDLAVAQSQSVQQVTELAKWSERYNHTLRSRASVATLTYASSPDLNQTAGAVLWTTGALSQADLRSTKTNCVVEDDGQMVASNLKTLDSSDPADGGEGCELAPMPTRVLRAPPMAARVAVRHSRKASRAGIAQPQQPHASRLEGVSGRASSGVRSMRKNSTSFGSSMLTSSSGD